jgi:isochorismate hydrolase
MSQLSLNRTNLISRDNALLLIIDVQEKLMPVIDDGESVADNILRLIKFSLLAGIPVIVTEQEKLGNTIGKIAREIPDLAPVRKLHFNSFACETFDRKIRDKARDTLVLTGVEAHICVAQTALYGLSSFKVHVVSDAVSSRTAQNRRTALERMQAAGATITSTEMFIYEILQKAGTDEFRATLPIVK